MAFNKKRKPAKKTKKSTVKNTNTKATENKNIEKEETEKQKKYTKTALKSLKKAQLVELALNMNLARIARLKKDEIIERILNAQEEVFKNTKPSEPKKVLLSEEEPHTYSSSKKYEVENIDFFIEPSYPVESRELPTDYGETKIVLLVRDPWWAYAYWEISNETRKELGIERGKHNKKMKIRLYDITEGERGEHFDVYVHDYTNNWYINLPKPNRKYEAELIIEDEEDLSPVAQSNIALAPNVQPSENIDVEWVTPEWANIYKASTGYRETEVDEKELLNELMSTNLSSMTLAQGPSSDSVGGLGASENMLSSMPSSESAIKISNYKEKDFWLRADCELIVYGATEADAEVKVKGDVVKLNPDGTFTLRFALPDGNHNIDIVGTNKDRDMQKQINFHITRDTE